jgi:DeoR/GlpR family transcriptional regulator of sugar metabolism
MGKRDNQIVDLVHKYGELSVQELSDLLSVSSSSVRRDLISLNDHRFVSRTHGGVRIAKVMEDGTPGIHRLPVDLNEARSIAREASKLIQPDDVIGISGGEICIQLAYLVRLLEDITVVTNAINIAAELVGLPGIQVRLTGGRLNQGSFELIGGGLEHSLRGVHIHKYFLGTDGLSVEYGVTGHDEAEAAASRVIMSRSDSTIVLADSSKFKKASFAQVAPISAFKTIITTDRVPKSVVDEFKNTGVYTIFSAMT